MGTLKVNNIQSTIDGSVSFPQGLSSPTQPVSIPNGTASLPSLRFDTDTDTGLYRIDANTIGISTEGVLRTRIDNNGIELINGTASNPSISFINNNTSGIYLSATNQISVSTNGNERLRIDSLGGLRLGSNTYAKTLGIGDIGLDNGSTDTPAILFYHGNNINYGIDTFFDSNGQRLRFVKNLNEAGGSELGYFDSNANFTVFGYLNPTSYKAGQVIKDTMLSNSEVTVVSTTIAATNSNVDFITYSYTPVSSSSYLIVHIHISKFINADASTGNDSWYSVLRVDGNEIAYGFQRTLNAFRSGTLFPLTGRYTNSSTTAKTIAVAARRDVADDSFTIDNTATAIWLRITEVAR